MNKVFLRPATVAEKKAKLAEERWKLEVGGIELNGIKIDTSDRSKLLINGMYDLAREGDPACMRKFKTADGIDIEITNSQACAIAVAVGDHVQKCINAESAINVEDYSLSELKDALLSIYNTLD